MASEDFCHALAENCEKLGRHGRWSVLDLVRGQSWDLGIYMSRHNNTNTCPSIQCQIWNFSFGIDTFFSEFILFFLVFQAVMYSRAVVHSLDFSSV